MNLKEDDMFGAALIGFDMIDGPFLKWEKQFDKKVDFINIDDFALNFYLSFRAGNTENSAIRLGNSILNSFVNFSISFVK